MKNFTNILIVRTDRIGDVVLTTPSLLALRKAYPDANITILLSSLTAGLMQGVDFVDEIIVDDRQHKNKGMIGFCRLAVTLRKKQFDLAIVYHTKKRTNLACFLAGIPYRLGYKNNKYGFLLNHPVNDPRHLGELHEAQYCLNVLKEIGIDSKDLTTKIAINDKSERWVEDFFYKSCQSQASRFVAIHPAASDPAKQWPYEYFIELLNMIIGRNRDIIFLIIGTAKNRVLAKSISGSVNGEVIDLCGQLDICQLASLLKGVELLISNDSGPVHIAAAVKTPVVSIFTRNQPGINPTRWKPLGDNSQVVSVPYDDTLSFKKAQNYDPKNMEPIAVQSVLEAVDSLCKLC